MIKKFFSKKNIKLMFLVNIATNGVVLEQLGRECTQ